MKLGELAKTPGEIPATPPNNARSNQVKFYNAKCCTIQSTYTTHIYTKT